jgi:hypothetical protein
MRPLAASDNRFDASAMWAGAVRREKGADNGRRGGWEEVELLNAARGRGLA